MDLFLFLFALLTSDAAAFPLYSLTHISLIDFSFSQDSQTVNPALDAAIAHALKVFVSTVLLHLIDRHSEYIQRVGFM